MLSRLASGLFLLGLGITAKSADRHRTPDLISCLNAASVLYSTSSSYDGLWVAHVKPWNLRLPYTPIAIAFPTRVRHVQDAVRCAVQHGAKINAKSGGHSYASFGLGGEDGHLVIDLKCMDSINVTHDGIARVQTGARLGVVAQELYRQGKRAISHGTCPLVGVGGHALHGGYGMSSYTHGLASDWIIGATIVLANSTVWHCSATENVDLFWAIRGAGSSFGIVTDVEFNTFAAPEEVAWFDISVPATTNPGTMVQNLLDLQNFTQQGIPTELNMRMALRPEAAHYNGLYYGNSTALRNVLRPLMRSARVDIDDLASDDFITDGDWLGQLGHFSRRGDPEMARQLHPHPRNSTFYASSLMTKELSRSQIENFVEYWFLKSKTFDTKSWYVLLDLHGGKNSAITKVSQDATAYAHRDKLFMMQFQDIATEGSYSTNGIPFLQGFMASLTDLMQPKDWGRYVNYPDSELERDEAMEQYWGSALGRLRAIKRIVDPDDVFYYPQSVRPAD